MKNTTTAPKNAPYKNDYQMNLEVAEKIINIIENGDVQSWRKAWTTPGANSSKKELFDLVLEGLIGINIFNFRTYGMIPDFIPAGFYVTFIDIKKHGLKLAKGSKGIPHYKPAIYNKFLTKNQQDAFDALLSEDPEIQEKYNTIVNDPTRGFVVKFTYKDTHGKDQEFYEYIMYSRKYQKVYYEESRYILEYFFKASDCGISNDDIKKMWGIDKDTTETIKNNFNRIENAEAVKNSYIERSHLDFEEVVQDRAYYSPTKHLVVVPNLNQFDTVENYYQVLYHEFAHSTGHSSLLNRKGVTSSQGFGSVIYSKEELVAELSSLYTLTNLKLINDDILKNSISYLKSWGESLKEGIKHNIMVTIAQSRKATNLILNINQDK